MQQPNPFAPPTAKVEDIEAAPEAGTAPPIWNPGAASSWSLFFSPVFGSILQMKNWRALGEPEHAENSKRWAIGSAVFYIVLGVAAGVLPDLKVIDILTRIGGLSLLITWYYMSGKKQQTYVRERFGKRYPRKGWSKPLFSAFGCLIAFMIGMGLIGALSALVFRL